eukprot:gb/GECH01000256.1/.p1 GENE.gb/GECH01000256.1/~~gb/GECH01000256.1/.p1  ORF type:complete len:304 (+),score=76.90 gb/GECH01000256.1/:1-912(+)
MINSSENEHSESLLRSNLNDPHHDEDHAYPTIARGRRRHHDRWSAASRFRSALHRQYSFRDIMNRIRFSRAYSLFYIVIILLTLFLLFWTIYQRGQPDSWWFLTLQGFVSSVLVFEVIIRLIMEKLKFFKYWMNIFDLGVSISVVVAFIFFIIDAAKNEETKEIEELADAILLMLRYISQLFMIASFIRRQQLPRSSATNSVHMPIDGIQLAEENPQERNEHTRSGVLNVSGISSPSRSGIRDGIEYSNFRVPHQYGDDDIESFGEENDDTDDNDNNDYDDDDKEVKNRHFHDSDEEPSSNFI